MRIFHNYRRPDAIDATKFLVSPGYFLRKGKSCVGCSRVESGSWRAEEEETIMARGVLQPRLDAEVSARKPPDFPGRGRNRPRGIAGESG